MKTISSADANRQFSKLLREVREGETVTITSHGRPVARLVGVDPTEVTDKDTGWLRLIDELESRLRRPDSERLKEKFSRDWAYDD